MKKRLLVFLLCLMVLINVGSLTAKAEGEVQLKSVSTAYQIEGQSYMDHSGRFQLNYVIDKGDIDVNEIVVLETLKDANNQQVGPKKITSYTNISEAKTEIVQGYGDFPTDRESAPYTVEYEIAVVSNSSETLVAKGQKTIKVVDAQLQILYQASVDKADAGQTVEYTAIVKSKANVPLYNIVVRDSALGEIGSIAVLPPGEAKPFVKPFVVNDTTESQAVVSFDDPLGIKESFTENSNFVKVEVEKEEAVASMHLSGSVDKAFIPTAGEVTFTLELKNMGNVPLENIECTDWNENVFYTKDELAPGETSTITYAAEVEPGQTYTLVGTARVKGSGQKIQEFYTAQFTKLEPKVEIERNIVPEKPMAGDTVKIEYTLRNAGTVALKDIKVEEPDFGEIITIDRMEPGEESSFSFEQVMQQQGISRTLVTAVEEQLGSEYQYEASEILIPVEIPPGTPHITFTLSTNPERLDEAGEVELKCLLKNDGDGFMENVSVTLVERDLQMGSILTFKPGEEQALTVPSLGIQEDESFSVKAKGQDQEGNWVEFASNPITIKVGSDINLEIEDTPQTDDGDPAQEEPQKDPPKDSKLSLLRNILLGIGALILVTAGSLVYFIKKIS